jgi:hypothetical protein
MDQMLTIYPENNNIVADTLPHLEKGDLPRFSDKE